ncbi:5-(carboxyamino)imidazole ribonucleotide mutase [Verrucomicrobium sp. 3C]|uniref:5-(carboxyamino)imidazole ribonucleotide mutase n=1 Tax=Verrucomicrobium sp. 3C TaxID=1134055 RepID=UPI000373EFA5|nr:5-(carboxyamino)imidazole ribonucleotide mutase [Verrucomicrobium sp. 3C]
MSDRLQMEARPVVAILMGSQSDWPVLQGASAVLQEFSVPHEKAIVSAHRTPDKLRHYASSATERGIKVLIAGAGGAAHLPGMLAAYTPLPVLGVPVETQALRGVDSLLSIVQMPYGIPVGCLAIGEAGARNAALLAVSILALENPELAELLRQFRSAQTQRVLDQKI